MGEAEVCGFGQEVRLRRSISGNRDAAPTRDFRVNRLRCILEKSDVSAFIIHRDRAPIAVGNEGDYLVKSIEKLQGGKLRDSKFGILQELSPLSYQLRMMKEMVGQAGAHEPEIEKAEGRRSIIKM